jgi:RHS repeat-associated protein
MGAAGHTTTYQYDALGRITATTDAMGHTTTTAYDANGNVTSITDATGAVTQYVYDAAGRRTAITDPLGHTTTTAYDAADRPTSVTDALGDTTTTRYDAAGDVTASIDALGHTMTMAYDAAGNVTSITDADGNTTAYTYDALNRRTLTIDPLGGRTTTTYDAAGRTSTITDADGRQQVFAYDAANRVTGVTWLSSGATVNQLTYTYDPNGNQLTATDNSGTYTNVYDAQNRLTSQTNPSELTLTYSYDAAGRMTQRADSLGGVLNYVYNNADRLTSEQFSGTGQTPLRTDFAYDNAGRLTGLTRYSNLAGSIVVATTAYVYDVAGRVTSITNKNASAGTLSYYSYIYDNADRVTSETWQSTIATGTLSGTNNYSYDVTNQLLGDGTKTYGYDANGNRNTTGYHTGANNHVTSDGVWTYTFDAVGDMIEKSKGSGLETWYYTYDTLNRLTTVQQTADGTTATLEATATYTYDVYNNLLKVQEWHTGGATTVTQYAYDGTHEWAEQSGTNALQVRDLYYGGQVLARTVSVVQPNAGVSWYFEDRLGSTTDIIGASSAAYVVNHATYDGYGNETDTNVAVVDQHGYAAGFTDRLVQFDHFGWRWYNPATGTWTSVDPEGFAAGQANLSQYVANDPTNATDPSGLEVPVLISVVPPQVPQQIFDFLYNAIDYALEPVRVTGDLERASQAGVWNAAGGTPYVPEWRSKVAQNAPPFADKEANLEYLEKIELENAEDGAILLATAGAAKGLGRFGRPLLGKILSKAATVGTESIMEDAAAQGKTAVYRQILSDANGRLLSRTERQGVKFTVRAVEALDYEVNGSAKYSGNRGIDLVFEGKGQNAGRIGLAEAKASRGLGSLAVDTQGIRQGSYRFFETRLQRGGRLDLLQLLQSGNADLFGGFSGSGRLYQFNPAIFFEDVNFKTTPGAAILVP